MAGLSGTRGKGVSMFTQRRQRLDQIALEQEEQEERRSRSLPPEATARPEEPRLQNHQRPEETYAKLASPAPPQGANVRPTSQQQENIQPMTNQIPEPKPLVPNRTAKPFGFINSGGAARPTSVNAPVARKHELKFKVPVPVNTSAQVWSPTGDIIASRDERISVPAKQTGALPGSKRRAGGKPGSGSSDHPLQNRGDRKSYIEPEEDFFSLGAEACNFMQPMSVKLKIPPPVAPKPVVDPDRQPWLSPPSEPVRPSRSPASAVFASAAGPQSPGQDWAQYSRPPADAWAPGGPSAQNQPRSNRNSWSAQPSQSPVSVKPVAPTQSPSSWNQAHDVASRSASQPAAQRRPPPPRAQGPSPTQQNTGPHLMGRGAALFARRQTRMEKFVVDGDTVQANRARASSPTPSLPNSWRYSSNIRAPPPLSYNPILAPFYPPAATKQPPSTSPKIQAKTRAKPKPKKHLSSLEVMKHQPYHLEPSLFTYEALPETRSPGPSPAPEVAPVPRPRKPRTAPSLSLARNKSDAPSQIYTSAPPGMPQAFGRSYSMTLPARLRPLASPTGGGPRSPGWPGFQAAPRGPAQRQASWQDGPSQGPTPWEGARRSPLGSLDQAFSFQGVPAHVASGLRAAVHRRSLPTPPADWTHRVALESCQAPGPRGAPATPACCGPPFRRGPRLSGGVQVVLGFRGTN